MQRTFLLPVCVSCLMCLGCSSGALPGVGTVQFEDGEPVRSGSIEFRSLGSGRRYASKIDSTGNFRLADQDGNPGIWPGQYEVVVVQIVITEDLALEKHSHGRTVPRRYADYYTSKLKATVTKDQTDPLTIVIAPE